MLGVKYLGIQTFKSYMVDETWRSEEKKTSPCDWRLAMLRTCVLGFGAHALTGIILSVTNL